jgi:excisionase family DNA binding protein
MSPARPRSDFFGKNKRSGRATVDDDALITRYVRDKWTLAKCAKAFDTTQGHVRDILTAHDIEIRAFPRSADLDEQQVLRMYDQYDAVQPIASVLNTDPARVREILDRHGVEIGAGSKPHLLWDEPSDPSPSDLLRPAQAAQVLGESKDFLYRATINGQIRAADRTEGGMRLYRRREVEELKRRLTRNEGEEYGC